MIPHLTAKEWFLKSTDVDYLAGIVGDPKFQHALHLAFALYSSNLPRGDGPQGGWDANSRRQGAKDFIDLLVQFPTQAIPQPRRNPDVLET